MKKLSEIEELQIQIKLLTEDNKYYKVRNKDLSDNLMSVLMGCWPYLHQHCTIETIKKEWKHALEILDKQRMEYKLKDEY